MPRHIIYYYVFSSFPVPLKNLLGELRVLVFVFERKKRGKVLQISLNQAAKIHINKKREFIFKENRTTKPM